MQSKFEHLQRQGSSSFPEEVFYRLWDLTVKIFFLLFPLNILLIFTIHNPHCLLSNSYFCVRFTVFRYVNYCLSPLHVITEQSYSTYTILCTLLASCFNHFLRSYKLSSKCMQCPKYHIILQAVMNFVLLPPPQLDARIYMQSQYRRGGQATTHVPFSLYFYNSISVCGQYAFS